MATICYNHSYWITTNVLRDLSHASLTHASLSRQTLSRETTPIKGHQQNRCHQQTLWLVNQNHSKHYPDTQTRSRHQISRDLIRKSHPNAQGHSNPIKTNSSDNNTSKTKLSIKYDVIMTKIWPIMSRDIPLDQSKSTQRSSYPPHIPAIYTT